MMRVIQLIDTLEPGGAERVAVNIANGLARRGYASHLCATRRGGPLEQELEPGVEFFSLQRSGRWDVSAVLRLAVYIRKHKVQIIHAHSSSLFIGSIVARLCGCKLVWHDHFGAGTKGRSAFLFQIITRNVGMVLSVTKHLAKWTEEYLNINKNHIQYLPNFIFGNDGTSHPVTIPGRSGERITCVANLRAFKDQIGLLRAFKLVIKKFPEAHLILVGAEVESDYSALLAEELAVLHLESNVTMLGKRNDIPAILDGSDIAVLASVVEGFPLVLLEYGSACLPVVATEVGECAEILDHGAAGILVPPGDPAALAAGLLRYLDDSVLRKAMAQKLHLRVQTQYSEPVIMERIVMVYKTILSLEGTA